MIKMKNVGLVESFSNWLSGYDINENIAAAKVYMQKKYANRLKWAKVLNSSDINHIANVIQEILLDKDMAKNMVNIAFDVACRIHDRKIVNSNFVNSLKFYEV